MAVRSILAACAGLSLAACTATTPDPAVSGVHPEAAALADLLLETGRSDPERIEAARGEMAALSDALTQTAPETAPETAPSPQPDPAPPAPAPDLSGARSVMSAAHLASYRDRAHAGPGWRALQAQFPALLADLEPRLAPADLGERGVFLRLKAGPLDSPAAARRLCARIEAAGAWCAPADFTGQALP